MGPPAPRPLQELIRFFIPSQFIPFFASVAFVLKDSSIEVGGESSVLGVERVLDMVNHGVVDYLHDFYILLL